MFYYTGTLIDIKKTLLKQPNIFRKCKLKKKKITKKNEIIIYRKKPFCCWLCYNYFVLIRCYAETKRLN